MRDTFIPRNSDLSFDPRGSFYAQLHKSIKKAMLHSVSGIQHRPQLPLRNKKDFVRERILNFCARRKTTHIDKSLIGSVGAFHKPGFTRNRRAVGIIAFCSLTGRSGCRPRRWRLRRCLNVFRWRRVRVKRLLCWLILYTGFGGIAGGATPRACRRHLVLGASRNKKAGKE